MVDTDVIIDPATYARFERFVADVAGYGTRQDMNPTMCLPYGQDATKAVGFLLDYFRGGVEGIQDRAFALLGQRRTHEGYRYVHYLAYGYDDVRALKKFDIAMPQRSFEVHRRIDPSMEAGYNRGVALAELVYGKVES